MKHGSTSMILKQNSSSNSGSHVDHLAQSIERSVKKVMATVFWDSKGVVLVDFLEGKKIVTGVYYVEVLRKLRAKLAEKRPGKLHREILFHHDNALAHSSRIVRDV